MIKGAIWYKDVWVAPNSDLFKMLQELKTSKEPQELQKKIKAHCADIEARAAKLLS